MKLTLKITKKDEVSMAKLVKKMCSLQFRIKLDLLNGMIDIYNIDDANVKTVINDINEVFDIIGVETTPEPESSAVPQDFVKFKQLKFDNNEVRDQVNKLLRYIFWVMHSKKATSRDICFYLKAVGVEIAMKYDPKEPIEVSIGDVVDCNYGSHVKGEVTGGHVHAIVCDIDKEGMVYVLPITKGSREVDEARFLPFSVNHDIEYKDTSYTDGTVLLKKGRYLNHQRFAKVIGYVKPEFFEIILEKLSNTTKFSFDSTKYRKALAEKFGDVENDDDMLSFIPPMVNDATDGSKDKKTNEFPAVVDSDEVYVEISPDDGTSETNGLVESDTEAKDPSAKVDRKVSAEDYLTYIFSDALESLNENKSIQTMADEFLDAIGMSKDEEIIKKAFIEACHVKRINYKSIVSELQKFFPNNKNIKATLQKEFTNWLSIYPDMKEKYPKISIVVLLKVFAKGITTS